MFPCSFPYNEDVKIFKQLLIIIAFALVGTVLSYLLSLIHVPFPGSLLGMVFLFIFLCASWIKADDIHDVAQFFIDNMGVFFVPGAVAILNNLQLISAIWWRLVIVIFAGFLVSFISTYYCVRLTLYLQARHHQKKQAKEVSHD